MMRWWRVLPLLLLLWSSFVFYLLFVQVSSRLASPRDSADDRGLLVDRLEAENARLRNRLGRLERSGKMGDSIIDIDDGPDTLYEQLRRRVARDLDEMHSFLTVSIDKALHQKSIDEQMRTRLNGLSRSTSERYRALRSSVDRLSTVDGHSEWRQQELEALHELIQSRLSSLQNPSDCHQSKQLVCNLNKGCGYGCQIHHAVYCFIVAYGTQRRLVLRSKGWRYNKAGFEDLFKPLSQTCPITPTTRGVKHWPPNEDTMVVEVGIIDSIYPRPNFLPPAVPADIAERLHRVHEHPAVWWVAQFLHYLLRPQQHLRESLEEAERRILGDDLVDRDPTNKPAMVGIHVRRTDKVGTEAAFHSVGEYMKHVEDYFKLIEEERGEEKVRRKLVFVATDDPAVLDECRSKYSDYEFLGDTSIARSASVASRYTSASLLGILIDVHLLSKTDFLVCTFSSQVCRLAYELMQLNQPFLDRTRAFKSLDDVWYFGGQDEHQQKAIMDHSPSSRNEIELKVGDVVGIAGNHWDGFNKGRNHRSNQIGLYPEFKVVERIKTANFPVYDNRTHE